MFLERHVTRVKPEWGTDTLHASQCLKPHTIKKILVKATQTSGQQA